MTVSQEQVESSPRTLEPVKTKSMVTMRYFGPKLNLSSDLTDDADEVMVDQQVAGGNPITVFRDVIRRGSKYSALTCVFHLGTIK